MQEGAYCRALGPEVTPRVYTLLPDGYVMEQLEPAPRHRGLLCEMENLLRNHVWHRKSVNYDVTGQMDYLEYHAALGLTVPPELIPHRFTMAHGDPTVSNALVRYKELRGDHQLVICDPRPPRAYIPQCPESDMGRLVQSAFGWEVVAYGWERIRYDAPIFWRNDTLRPRALFWCAAACKRIEKKELSKPTPRPHVLEWCETTVRDCMRFIYE